MFAEVIKGRFGAARAADAAPYALPVSAEIGLPVLDEAHAALLARLNAAHHAVSAGDQAQARLQLDLLRSDLTTHFDIEEQIMQALGFAAVRDHVRRHAAHMAELDEICRGSLSRGSLTVGDLDVCFRGLVDEILRGDVDLKSHFQSMGSRRAGRKAPDGSGISRRAWLARGAGVYRCAVPPLGGRARPLRGSS